MAEYDLVIRGGTIVDGSGGKPYEGDIAVTGRRIAAVGAVSGTGREEIDASGMLVTPGFVDIHTHYDGQVTWEHRLRPSTEHGVTTAVMGNCGIGFAPCRPQDRQTLIRLMEGVEDLPEPVLTAGLPWKWESFSDYLDFLEGRQFDCDVVAQLPHAALRVYAMGQRAIERQDASSEDRMQMARLAREAIRAGAFGFATSRTIHHRSSDGTHIPTLDAGEAELIAIARALADEGRGVLQLVSDLDDVDAELAMLRRVVEASGRPLTLSTMQWHHSPEKWRTVLAWLDDCAAAGLPIKGQVSGRPIGLLLGFELSMNPFLHTPTFRSLLDLSPEDRRQALRDPLVRARITSEEPIPQETAVASYMRNFAGMYALGEPVNYEPDPADSMTGRAARNGSTPAEEAYDAMMAQDGRGVLMLPSVNFAHGNLEASRVMLGHPQTVFGLGDGGAHLGFLCDASLPTHLLQYWARDRVRGPRLSLPAVVRGLTAVPAETIGLDDRGLLKSGYKADINIIDFNSLHLGSPYVVHDLPENGRRVTQGAQGYVATILSGWIVQRDGISTGALPGRLVRSGTRNNAAVAA